MRGLAAESIRHCGVHQGIRAVPRTEIQMSELYGAKFHAL